MIVPSPRLLILTAAIVLPAASLAGLVPGLFAPCAALLALYFIVVAFDAVGGTRRLAKLLVRTPKFLRFTKDVPSTVPITIDNRSPNPLSLRLAVTLPQGVSGEPAPAPSILPAGSSLFPYPITTHVRGDHPLPAVHLETPSPLGLWLARDHRHPDFTFRVYPNLRDRATASLFLKTAAAGLRTRRQIGKGREFDNLRAYAHGDSFEDIHWKATARRGFPVVKLYRVEHAQEVYAIVDSSRLSAREGILESYVNAALHLALVAERQGDRFGLVTFSDRTHRFVRARGGIDHFRLCRETIYNLRAQRVSPDFREVFTSLQLNLRRRSLLVFFTSLDDALLAEIFEREIPLLARRHLVVVNVTRTAEMRQLFTGEPPQDLDTLYEGLAGQMLWNRMRTLTLSLQNRGVKLAIVNPDRIKAEVTAEYLDVKRRQTL
ncbi:MAG TPA: DUF58 domain-containing protein [Bryobacteraceae bacterium]|jgi:uncharacterized protein (DUF58 family)